MNQYVTGTMIRELREKKKMTQMELAGKLMVSDKAVSKWETGRGYPDITLLEPLAQAFGISLSELLTGNTVENRNVSANMLHSKFCVCPICGNLFTSTGEGLIHCHGIRLTPEPPEEASDEHSLIIEEVEDEYYVSLPHEMRKEHYISFIAALSSDRLQICKLYPEGNAEARFKRNGIRQFVWFCNRHGLFGVKPATSSPRSGEHRREV